MKKINNELELLSILYEDVDSSDKNSFVFLGGHFPLVYFQEGALEAIDYWGKFSEYTLELSCKVAKYAKKKGKDVSFVFFVDDHMYEPLSNLSAAQLSTRRNKLYKLRSGKDAKLPELYAQILNEYGFSEDDVIRQNHNKSGREDCLYFSEKILRSLKRSIDNPCAREYVAFIKDENYFSKNTQYMIAFIPQRCRDNICNHALNVELAEFGASHLFVDSAAKLASKEELFTFGRGILYRKD